MTNSIISLRYTNSAGVEYAFDLNINNQLQNLMEIVRDYGFEDWGECRGRAWCRTCHIRVELDTNSVIAPDEEVALRELETRYFNSRLACQLEIDSTLDGVRLTHAGDN